MEERQTKDAVENAEQKKQKKSEKDRNGMMGGIVFGILFVLLAYAIYKMGFEFPIVKMGVYIAGIMAFVCFMVSVSCFFDLRESKKLETLEEEARREEMEFSGIDPGKRALRAEKMFRMNQKELKRYYDMNLAQTKFLSSLGIVLIIFGLLVLSATIIMYATFKSDTILLMVGSLSGIVVDFIGAIFIKMYTHNIEASIKFHAKLAESNNLLLANSIANKIDSDNLRENTLSEISQKIVMSKNASEK